MLQISPSQINEVRVCSARYAYNRVKKLPNPRGIPLVYGTAIDNTVERMLKDKMLGHIQSFNYYRGFLEWVYEGEAAPTTIDRETLDSYFVQAEAVVSHYFDTELHIVEPMRTQVQNKFETSNFRVHQVWDLLTLDDVVVDYKAPLKRFGKQKGEWRPKSFDHVIQIYAYYHGFIAEFGYEPAGLELNYLLPPEQKVRVTHPPEIVKVRVDYDEIKDEAEDAVVEALRLIERARDGKYAPRRGKMNFLCSQRLCPFHEACVAEFGGKVRP